MKIGFDAKRAVANFTGLGNYSRYAISTISEAYPEHEYLLYAPHPKENPRLQPILDLPNTELFTPGSPWSNVGALWRSFGMTGKLKSDKLDLYHGLSNELPLNIARSGIPSVVTIHDVIWRRIPKDYAPIDRKFCDIKYGHSAHNATRIIAISECTKRDLITDFKVDPEKIDVIYQGCDPQFSRPVTQEEIDAVKAKYSLPERYIACVGTVQRRKNQMLAVRAMKGLPKDVKLVIVGSRQQKDYAERIDSYIAKYRLSNQVVWLSNVPFCDLPALYAGARFSAYPSRYEGFGLPIIESLSTGTPVIAAVGSCLEEAGGRGAVYVNPRDLDEYIWNAVRLLDDDSWHDNLAAYGLDHVKKFTPEAFAAATMATYQKALAQ